MCIVVMLVRTHTHTHTLAVNLLDRHVETDPTKVALIWERDEPEDHQIITYQ